MTRKEIKTMLGTVDVDTAYYQFDESTGQQPPFICFYYSNSRDFMADNINYQKIDHLVVELYTKEKDLTLETKLENAFAANGLTWVRYEQYLDDQRMMVQVYDLDVVITDIIDIEEGQNNG